MSGQCVSAVLFQFHFFPPSLHPFLHTSGLTSFSFCLSFSGRIAVEDTHGLVGDLWSSVQCIFLWGKSPDLVSIFSVPHLVLYFASTLCAAPFCLLSFAFSPSHSDCAHRLLLLSPLCFSLFSSSVFFWSLSVFSIFSSSFFVSFRGCLAVSILLSILTTEVKPH